MKNMGKKFLLFIMLIAILVSTCPSLKTKCYAEEGDIVIHGQIATDK